MSAVAVKAIAHVEGGADLDAATSTAVFQALMTGEMSEHQISTLLAAIAAKGPCVDEIEGAARAMREALVEVPTSRVPIDTCGTGGSGVPRRNVSTAVALVAAALGVPVAKHGNRAASSKSGSADVLEALGVDITLSAAGVGRCIDDLGLGFLYARALHPAMAHAAPVRRALGIPTIFNLLGPMTNPARVERQVMGLFDPRYGHAIAEVLGRLGATRAFVVHGMFRGGTIPAAGGRWEDRGIDDVSTEGPSAVWEWRAGAVRRHVITPEDAGLARVDIRAMGAGDPEDNAAALRRLLDGARDEATAAYRTSVAFAGALALLVAGDEPLESLPAAARRVLGALDDGSARAILDRLVAASRRAQAE